LKIILHEVIKYAAIITPLPVPCVTLHEIVRMRRFVRVAAANLRIILHEIIKYAAKTIAPQIGAKRSMA
jgi:hypothetical protein